MSSLLSYTFQTKPKQMYTNFCCFFSCYLFYYYHTANLHWFFWFFVIFCDFNFLSVRNEDVDMAIRVMVESFIAAQKYSVQTTLRRKFRRYLVYKKHNNSLIMHILQQMVRDQMTFEQMRQGARGGAVNDGIERVEIREEDLLTSMRELDIHDITTFLKSREFTSHGFIYDKGRKTIIRNV